jgi:hypothetical protein
MNYMLLVAETQADFDKRTDPGRAAALGEAWKAYSDALRKAGVLSEAQDCNRHKLQPRSGYAMANAWYRMVRLPRRKKCSAASW